MTKVSDKVTKIVGDHLGIKSSDINLSNNIINDLKGDSLDFSEILAQIEEEFNITISDEDAEKILTLNDISNISTYYMLKNVLSESELDSELNNLFLKDLEKIDPIKFSHELDFVKEFKKNADSKKIKEILE